MSDSGHLLSIYLHLAAASQRRRRPHVRDRLLLLAGTIASQMGLHPVAACCRQRVLAHNPRHLVGRWPTIATALMDDEFLCFLKQLQRRYPQEKAERLLQSLGIELARERKAYFSDYEYAAALLGSTTDELDREFGEG